MRPQTVTFFMLAIVTMVPGCPKTISVLDYERTCDVDNDCILVAEPCCGQPLGAISKTEGDRLEADMRSAREDCPGHDCLSPSIATVMCIDGGCDIDIESVAIDPATCPE